MNQKFFKISLMLAIIAFQIVHGASRGHAGSGDAERASAMGRPIFGPPLPPEMAAERARHSAGTRGPAFFDSSSSKIVSRFECGNGMIVERLSSGGTSLKGSFSLSGRLSLTKDMTDEEFMRELSKFGRVTYINLRS